MMDQLRLDFSAKPIISGKKRQRIAIPCSDEFLSILDILSTKFGTTRAELAFNYVLEGMQKSLGNAFMAEPHLDKSLRQLLGGNDA
jgi:hypothetical protein